MSQNLIIKPITELASNRESCDILSLYQVPGYIDSITKKDRENVLNALNCNAVIADAVNEASDAKGFFVEIPKGLRDLIDKGEAYFDNSSVSPGNFTPNIRVNGKTGIQGQASIYQGTDSKAITRSVSNLAMMAMVQSVISKMENIDEKLDKVIQGQKNDRIGIIIGNFKSFAVRYDSYKNEEEMRTAAAMALSQMQGGLAQMHLQIEEERKDLENAPKSNWQVLLGCWRPVNKTQKYQKTYTEFVYDIQVYNRLIILSDILLKESGSSIAEIRKNHQQINEYLSTYITDEFKASMNYLMQSKTEGIDKIEAQIRSVDDALLSLEEQPLMIQCNPEEFKYLKNK